MRALLRVLTVGWAAPGHRPADRGARREGGPAALRAARRPVHSRRRRHPHRPHVRTTCPRPSPTSARATPSARSSSRRTAVPNTAACIIDKDLLGLEGRQREATRRPRGLGGTARTSAGLPGRGTARSRRSPAGFRVPWPTICSPLSCTGLWSDAPPAGARPVRTAAPFARGRSPRSGRPSRTGPRRSCSRSGRPPGRRERPAPSCRQRVLVDGHGDGRAVQLAEAFQDDAALTVHRAPRGSASSAEAVSPRCCWRRPWPAGRSRRGGDRADGAESGDGHQGGDRRTYAVALLHCLASVVGRYAAKTRRRGSGLHCPGKCLPITAAAIDLDGGPAVRGGSDVRCRSTD